MKKPQWAGAYPDLDQIPTERWLDFNSTFVAIQPFLVKEVTQKMDRGWLRPFLLLYDTLLYGRWQYWLGILKKGSIEDAGPIPQIKFQVHSPGIEIGRKMLAKLAGYNHDSARNLIDWLLWGFGDPIITERPKIDPAEERFFYENFDLMVLLANPTDYFSQYAIDHLRQDGVAGYFPTPLNVCQFMVEMQVADHFEPDKPPMPTNKKVLDPCVGAGAMLLPASNYFLRLYGTDINLLMIKLCKLHMWLYAPWGATGDGGVDWGPEEEPIMADATPPEALVRVPNTSPKPPKKYRNVDISFLELDLDIETKVMIQSRNDDKEEQV